MERLVIFIFLLFLTVFNGFAQISGSRLERIVDSIAMPLTGKSIVSGMVIGVMRNDSILLLKSYGYADLEFDVKMPVDALFEIGSITKQFTAVAVMQLVEKRLLKLDDPISNYLSLNTGSDGYTIRQLLNHTSGIHEPGMENLIHHNYPRDTLLRLIEKGEPAFKAGTSMIYSNTGYNILGMLVEKVSGVTYGTYLQQNVFAKAGMKNIFLSDQVTVRKSRAHGYNNINEDSKLTRAEQPDFYWTFAAGALSSTAEDLLKWVKALHTGESLLGKACYKEFIAPGNLKDGSQLRYAKGLQVLKYKGTDVVGHGGSGSGILADTRYFPAQKLAIVVLQSTYRRASESEISYAIANKLIPCSKVEAKFTGDLSIYKGTYKGLLEISVDVVDSRLIVKRSWQTKGDTLTYIGNGKWTLGADEYSFRIENGKVTEMHWDPISAYIVLKRVNV